MRSSYRTIASIRAIAVAATWSGACRDAPIPPTSDASQTESRADATGVPMDASTGSSGPYRGVDGPQESSSVVAHRRRARGPQEGRALLAQRTQAGLDGGRVRERERLLHEVGDLRDGHPAPLGHGAGGRLVAVWQLRDLADGVGREEPQAPVDLHLLG